MNLKKIISGVLNNNLNSVIGQKRVFNIKFKIKNFENFSGKLKKHHGATIDLVGKIIVVLEYGEKVKQSRFIKKAFSEHFFLVVEISERARGGQSQININKTYINILSQDIVLLSNNLYKIITPINAIIDILIEVAEKFQRSFVRIQ